jgi:putative salt-induced outer membrane protein YdiY
VKVKPEPLALNKPSPKPPAQPATDAKGKQLPKKIWKGEISPGYNRRTGNTNSSDLYLNGRLSKKTKEDEAEIRGEMFYSSQEKRMAAQRYYGMGRYANNFGVEKKWNVFGKTEGDHDRFGNINFRVTPSAGVGYKFSDKPEWKLLTELGVGMTFTDYRDSTEDRSEAVLVPRLFLEKKVFERLRFSQDLTVYPSLTEGGYRFRSETSLINAITQKISIRLRFIDDYNSDPGLPGVKKNDTRLVSSLVYLF